MCGIVGYIGPKDVDSVILVGLEKLEYRGYDSAGIAALHRGKLFVRKKAGRIKSLYEALNGFRIDGNLGIGHTRWATHGKVTDENAHPHVDCNHRIAVVHNGIIENYAQLKQELENEGHTFASDTDTEIIPHLIEKYYDGHDFLAAVRQALQRLEGSFALAIISQYAPNLLIGVRKGSPLIVGIGEGEYLLASDIPALLSHTKDVIVLEDGEMAVLTDKEWQITDFEGRPLSRQPKTIEWDARMVEKEGYPHFMLKEIHEQPTVLRNNLEKYIKWGEFTLLKDFNLRRLLLNKSKILFQACGTSLHAGMVGKYLLEYLARMPADAEFSSEFLYRSPVIDHKTLVVAISQSGETADTLSGVRMAKEEGLEVLSIVNVVDSSIARESDYVIYINAGPEIGVASTKAYTAQLLILSLLALELGALKGFITENEIHTYLEELKALPAKIEKVLAQEAEIQKIAQKYHSFNNFMFLGRGINYPTALEGALKLKEISYIHAVGYAAGEMKHGPIALIDEHLPVVVINPSKTSVHKKTASNIREVHARGGKIILLRSEGDEESLPYAKDVLTIPQTLEPFTPILSIVPLQLLAYHIAVLRGCDVDKPRNLAKSVTVE